ncbi:MAG: phosphoglycerate kinase [Planctomycetaceae bacterium]|nr:phosphoglycerate kinase [Planctomycetaceae bacterium]
MAVSVPFVSNLIRSLLGADAAANSRKLVDYLAGIPRLETLADVPSGTPVLIRGDVDAKPGATIGDGDIRLRSMLKTLEYGRQKGWKQIIIGHIGRKPEGSLDKVTKRLGELLKTEVPLVDDWYDAATGTVTAKAADAIKAAAPGSVIVLQNSRKYDIERVLWKAKADEADKLAPQLAKFAQEVADKIAKVYINEALSAGSLDTSSTVLPAAMDRSVLGAYVAQEFDGPMRRCLDADLVVFSGLKTDKLDDLQAVIDRGRVKWVFVAGNLVLALVKAQAELAGKQYGLGLAEKPENSGEPWFIERSRVEQAKQMLTEASKKGINFVLPVDFTLADGRSSATIGPEEQNFDIGSETSKHFAAKIGEFIESLKSRPAGSPPAVAFHNGVFGMFEDPRYEAGTKNFMPQLKRMKDAGVEVYIGGGEGGAAMEKYGAPDWITHCFTAGGTVLNALGSSPVPYLVTLYGVSHR